MGKTLLLGTPHKNHSKYSITYSGGVLLISQSIQIYKIHRRVPVLFGHPVLRKFIFKTDRLILTQLFR